ERAAQVVRRIAALRRNVTDLHLRRVGTTTAEMCRALRSARARRAERCDVTRWKGAGAVRHVDAAAHRCTAAALVGPVALDLIPRGAGARIDTRERRGRARHGAAHLIRLTRPVSDAPQ